MSGTSATDLATLIEAARKNPLYYLAGEGRRITEKTPELIAIVTNRELLFSHIESHPFSSLQYISKLKDVPNGAEVAQKIAFEAPGVYALMRDKVAENAPRIDFQAIEQYYKEHPEEYFQKTLQAQGAQGEDFRKFMDEVYARSRITSSGPPIDSPAALAVSMLSEKYSQRQQQASGQKIPFEDELLVRAALADPVASLNAISLPPQVAARVAEHIVQLPTEDETRRKVAKDMATGRLDDTLFPKTACAQTSDPSKCQQNPMAFPQTEAGKLAVQGARENPFDYLSHLTKDQDFAKSQTHAAITRAMGEEASIMASATPFFFCTTQKHLTVKSV
jgi:hypothetical protein